MVIKGRGGGSLTRQGRKGQGSRARSGVSGVPALTICPPKSTPSSFGEPTSIPCPIVKSSVTPATAGGGTAGKEERTKWVQREFADNVEKAWVWLSIGQENKERREEVIETSIWRDLGLTKLDRCSSGC
jgi:hypothetical protein